MKRIIIYVLSLFLLIGCQRDENATWDGEGILRLKVNMKSDVQVAVTRSLTALEEEALKKECKVRIYDADKLIRKYQGAENVPTDLMLPSGEYRVRVTAGDSVAASFDKKFYEGVKSFTIVKGREVSVDVICNIANTVTKVAFAESLNAMFKDCQTEIAVKAEGGALTFNVDNLDDMGYYSLPGNCDTLFCKFTGTIIANEKLFEHIDTIPFIAAATRYDLTYEYKELDVELPSTGGGMFHLQVDATPFEQKEEEVIFYRRPVIKADMAGQTLDLSTPYYAETGSGSEVSMLITGSSALTSVEIESEQFPEYLSTAEKAFDLSHLTIEQETALNNGGIMIDRKEESKGYALHLSLSDDLIRKYTALDGTRSIRLTVIDENGKMRVADWQIIASNASVQTVNPPIFMVWATKATLYGAVLPGREPKGSLTFQYRKEGELVWSMVDAVCNEATITAEVTGLEGNTTYEYQLVDDGMASSVVCSFTTEAKAQLPNSGLEEWTGSKPMYVAASTDESAIYWDTGNHGSSSVGMFAVDLTVKDTSLKMEGSCSAKLQSKYIVIKFAAGNLFSGRYLKTDGTDGILGWGRPFTSRPIAITGYMRYASGIVDHESAYIKKGENDKGYMFMALGDWKGEEYNGQTWPVIIKTKNSSQLFDNQNPEIIAYGEKTWDASTEGEGMHRFTIRVDYRNNRIPNSIIVVASASKYGDYFSGSSTSIMWLDDLKLVYDESELTE